MINYLTDEWFFLGVDPHMDLQGIGGEKGLAAVATFVLKMDILL